MLENCRCEPGVSHGISFSPRGTTSSLTAGQRLTRFELSEIIKRGCSKSSLFVFSADFMHRIFLSAEREPGHTGSGPWLRSVNLSFPAPQSPLSKTGDAIGQAVFGVEQRRHRVPGVRAQLSRRGVIACDDEHVRVER